MKALIIMPSQRYNEVLIFERVSFFLKTKNPRSKKFRYIDLWRHLTFKIDLHPPGTPKPSKKPVLLK